MTRYLFYISLLFLISCGTSSISVNVQRPADISVPQNIQDVIIANRSVAGKGNITKNIVEGFFSGEGIGADKKGSEYCVMGLSQMLSSSDRYNLKNTGEISLDGTGTSSFPDLLSWKKVQRICDSYGADALIVLATFDSDSRVVEGKPVIRKKKVKGEQVKETRFPVTLIMDIESGWRIYDAHQKKIIDVNKFTEVKEYVSWGSSYNDARIKLPSKRHSLKESGILAGEKYGFRISPIWVNVSRTYFASKEEKFKLAKSCVKLGDWDGAIGFWKDMTSHDNIKLSRRAYFNLAVAAEVKGQLDVALEYAKKSRDLGEKRAVSYIKTLNSRKQDEIRLKEQLNN